MSHYIKKLGDIGEITEILVGDDIKQYYLTQKSFQGWKIEDSTEGNTIDFVCPQLKQAQNLERAAFYQVFSPKDKVNPIACFELTDIQYDYLINQVFVWKCTGKSWRRAASKMIISLKESRISFKSLCKKILFQMNQQHYAFNLDDSFIEEHLPFEERYGRGYKARAYCKDVLDDLENLGYRIYFDSNLKMHGYHESTSTVRKINYDSDTRIHEKKISYNYAESPSGRIIIKANNVVSDNYTAESFTSTGDFSQKFILSEKAAEPVRLFLGFDSNTELTSNFEDSPIGNTADELKTGNLQVNSLSLGNFLNHKRNYKNTLNGNGGIVAGTRFFISQNTGEIALLGLQSAPEDQPSSWVGGFFVKNNKLKIIFNGSIQDIDFPDLIPTIRTNITGINGQNISVIDSTGFKLGETVYIEQDGQTVNYGVIQSISSNLITLINDPLMTFYAGQTILQQSTYLIKWVYYTGSLMFYAKRSVDTIFKIVGKYTLNISGNAFIQLYANNGHKAGLDFFDLQENLEIFVSRNPLSVSDSKRNLDIAFDDSASQLASEVQVIINDDNKFELKFEAPTAESFYTAESIISPNSIKLLNITDLKIGDRLLIDSNERFIESVNTDEKIITWLSGISGLVLNIPIIKNDIFPAKNQVLQVSYRTRKDEVLPLCPSNCLSVKSKIPEIINLSFENQVKYSDFRTIAKGELEKLCFPQLVGTFTMIIESKRGLDLGVTNLLEDIPKVGETIVVKSPRYKPDFDGMQGYITNVVLSSVSHENAFKAEITIGNPKNRFDSFLYALNKNSKTNTLINEELPENDIMCLIQERVNVSVRMTLSELEAKSFYNENYSTMISEYRRYAYSDSISLINVLKWSARSQRNNNCFISELVN